MKELYNELLKMQDEQQERTDELWETFKEMDRDDEDYNKIASDYYYHNGMNNMLVMIITKVEKEMYK